MVPVAVKRHKTNLRCSVVCGSVVALASIPYCQRQMGADFGRNFSPRVLLLKYVIGFFARTITAKGRTFSAIEGNGDEQAQEKPAPRPCQ
jgi:hypothetical protein